MDNLLGLLETGATLGSGALSGLLGMPYGLYKGVTSGAYGTPLANRIAEEEARKFMERNTYIPRTQAGQENLQAIAGLLEKSKLPPVMPEISLLGQIPRQAYAAQAERAGMAAERALEPVVQRTLERGGKGAQLLQDLGQGSRSAMLDIPEPKAAQSLLDTSYRGSHTAPGPDFGAPLYDLTGGGQMYPADVYSPKAVQYYGTGYPKADKEAFALANKVRGNPDAEVTMYRAVPKDESISNINAGDWVTLSKDYAQNHGESVLGDYKILSKKVKAKDLWTNADSIHEFGYWPEIEKKLRSNLLETAEPKAFDVTRRDASDIFGAGAERVKYTDPKSGGVMEVLAKPDGTASVISLEVPETSRGKGIGQSLQAQVMQDFPEMMGQVSSKAAAKTAYRLGRRPPGQPNATLDDVYKIMEENSSVNLVSPEMQKRFLGLLE